MRQFDVFQNPSERSRAAAPFIVLLQSHFLAALPTAVVAPLLIDDGRSAYTEASVVVTFIDASYIVSTPELVAIDVRHLRRPLGDISNYADEIRRALDRLFTGF